jgi:hypothetical protein
MYRNGLNRNQTNGYYYETDIAKHQRVIKSKNELKSMLQTQIEGWN